MNTHLQRSVLQLVIGGMTMLLLHLAVPASHADGRELGDLKIAPTRVPTWMPGVDGGIPQVAVKTDARQAGCAGDGTHDDLPALQKAVDSVERPGAVFLPAGTYLLRGELKLPSGVVLRGAGPEATRLIAENPKPSTAAIKFRYSKNLPFDMSNGKQRKSPGMGIGASPLMAGKYIYMIDSGNCVIVMELGREPKHISKNTIEQFLYCVGEK